MKEALYKIPLIDAFKTDCECPFCVIERDLENKALDFVVGSDSYMQSDIREQTDKTGFCRDHLKKMFEFGNAQGNGLILNTHYRKMIDTLKKKMGEYKPAKASLKEKLPIVAKSFDFENPADPMASWCVSMDKSCYVCDYMKNTFDRYFDTFFHLYKKEPDFVDMIRNCKGFCLHHFGYLMEASRSCLSEKDIPAFTALIFPIMEQNMNRVQEDVSWFCDKFDYRNKDADWKNSRDAIQRGMEKLRGIRPDIPPHKQDK
ncbi:MAG: hypothetical protein II799_00990 [Lachnospiraceae bacterium]|nr:hypothetical protein [Lachnospiraceae bacterium]MBR0149199.1 hypothetical protein [Lachnospiraceae bacterium]MBR4173799.1 hypothetical protein [Lachnospiraceae bacterium]